MGVDVIPQRRDAQKSDLTFELRYGVLHLIQATSIKTTFQTNMTRHTFFHNVW